MAITIANVQTFTDAELLTLYRNAMAQLAVSESTTINGRTVRRSQLPQIRETLEWLERRIDATENESIALATLNRA